MADAAQIGASASNYTGDPNIGGGSLGAGELNVNPLMQLGYYTMLYNKAKWDQKQKDTDEKIAQISKIADIHVNDLRGKDRDEIIAQLNDLIDYGRNYAKTTPKNQQEKIQQNLEWQKKLLDVTNNYTSGKQRALAYLNQYNAVQEEASLSDATKAEYLKQLNSHFDNTKIHEPIPSLPNFNLQQVGIPKMVPSTQSVLGIDQHGNFNVDTKIDYFNPAVNANVANKTLFALSDLYKAQPQTEQEKLQSTVTSDAKTWADAAGNLNSVLQAKDAAGKPKYFTADANGNLVFDAKKFEDENAANTTVMNAYHALKSMDQYSRQKKGEVSQGLWSDKGNKFKIPAGMKASDFDAGVVDFNSGAVSAQQILSAAMFADWSDKIEKKVVQTNIAIDTAHQGLEWAKFNLERDKFKATVEGTEQDKTAALAFAKGMFADISSKASQRTSDGGYILSPDDIRKLGQDQLKYLGVETPIERDATGKIISSGGLQPLSLNKTDDKGNVISKDVLLLEPDGTLKVLKDATWNPDKKMWEGSFDQERSTSVWNAARNVLNEENVKAGSKERNAYFPIDLKGSKGAIQVDESGGKVQFSGLQSFDYGGKTYYTDGNGNWFDKNGTPLKKKK